MKLEIDLTKIADPGGPQAGRVMATALLSALPHDEAELAIIAWNAAQHELERSGNRRIQFESIVDPIITRGDPPLPGAPLADRGEDQEPGPLDPTVPEAGQFAYRGKVSSPKKRGPAAVLTRALADITACTSIEELRTADAGEWEPLATWLDACHHERLGTALRTAVLDRLTGLTQQGTRHTTVTDEPLAADADQDTRAADVGSDDVSDIPFEPTPADAATEAHDHGRHELSELGHEAMHHLGQGVVRATLAEHGASKLSDLDDAGAAAVRSIWQAALIEAGYGTAP